MTFLHRLTWFYVVLVLWGAAAEWVHPVVSAIAAIAALAALVARRPHRIVRFAAASLVLIVHLRWCFVDWAIVDGPSMQPSLQPGDLVIVQKRGGVLPPVTPFLHARGLARLFEPQLRRGDVIVVRYPALDATRTSRIVKRVAALGGDHYELKDNALFVNGVLERDGVGAASVRIQPPPREISPVVSALGTVAEYAAANGAPLRGTVPEHSVFLLGDNSEDSRDSRSIGYVPVSFVEGTVMNLHSEDRNVPNAQ